MEDASNSSHYTGNSSADSAVSTSGDSPIEALVYYRTPHDTRFTKLVQYRQPRTLTTLHDLPLSEGYVIMPFVVTEACPIVFIEPDRIEESEVRVPQHPSTDVIYTSDAAERRTAYAQSFASAHGRLLRNELKKEVLSRQLHLHIGPAGQAPHSGASTVGDEAGQLRTIFEKGYAYFLKACHYRPNSFVSFWWTRATGAWLVATPEPLLEKHHHDWGTVALAGTLPWKPGETPAWNEKNKEEQAIVQRFIGEQLKAVTTDLKQSETYTLHTGNIQHLCTDFRFGLPTDEAVREVLVRLHPTPAVCGLPRCEAREAILQDEPHPRRYYAGFSGPLMMHGETHLYVSLRCMEFTANTATLYAGGGLMPESKENEEWDETQRKMQTMHQLFLAPRN